MNYDVKKIRRRIEDWLRKKATGAQIVAYSYGKNHRAFFEKRHAARCTFMGHPVTVCVR